MTKTLSMWADELSQCPGGTTLSPEECDQLVAAIRDAAAGGLDLSPGDPGAAFALREIERLERLVEFHTSETAQACQQYREVLAENTNLKRAAHEPRALPEVGGDSLPITLADFERGCKVHLAEEQSKINPDNALIGLLCNAVRLARENERMGKMGIALPPEVRPTAWMRGFTSYRPGEPDEYDVECYYGDEPPADGFKWTPLYTRAAQPPVPALVQAAERVRDTSRSVPEYANEILVSREVVGKLALELSRFSLTKEGE